MGEWKGDSSSSSSNNNTSHKEFSDTLYFAKNFLFRASITSFTVDTLNSLLHSSVT